MPHPTKRVDTFLLHLASHLQIGLLAQLNTTWTIWEVHLIPQTQLPCSYGCKVWVHPNAETVHPTEDCWQICASRISNLA